MLLDAANGKDRELFVWRIAGARQLGRTGENNGRRQYRKGGAGGHAIVMPLFR